MAGESGYGQCGRCGRDMIKGPNGVGCVPCSLAGSVTKPGVSIGDPGEDALRAKLSAVGVIAGVRPTGISISGQPLTAPPVVHHSTPEPVMTNQTPYDTAIAILRKQPLPIDIKIYKKLLKAIKLIEELRDHAAN